MGAERTRTVRAALAAAALVVSPLVASPLVASCGRESSGEELDPVRSSTHVEELLRPCTASRFYDRDLSSLVPVLVDKLMTGQGEPLRRAKEQLGAMGATSVGAIRRLFDRYYADAAHAPYVENALDAIAQNATDEAHDVLLRALDHPMESVRHRSMLGLSTSRARPADFELLAERATGNDTLTLRRLYATAMHLADPARAEAEFLRWLERGEQRDLWVNLVPLLAPSGRPETAARCARLYGEQDPILAAALAAPAARAGDADAVAFLHAELEAEDPARRIRAVAALRDAGRTEDLVGPLHDDPDDQVRLLALAGVESSEVSPEGLRWLRAALDDRAPAMRGEAMKALCAMGDEGAVDRALAQLGEEPARLQQALLALRDPMLSDPALARRAFDRLVARHRDEEHRPVQQRTATFKAIGVVPLPEAARFLRTIAIASEGEVIESLRAHDWLMIHASNTGVEGRALLFDDLKTEEHPLRRIELIVAVGSARDDAARQALLALVEGEARTPVEVLVAASRLVKVGPATVVAPRLKRVSNRMEDPEVRRALQCLMWRWY